MRQKLLDIVHEIKDKETYPLWALVIKLSEEAGELSETMLNELGMLDHKDKEFESPFGEAADVILVALNILTTHYSDMSAEEIVAELEKHIDKKHAKYRKKRLESNGTKSKDIRS